MLNTSSCLISQMIGRDDDASAIVFAIINIAESYSVGGVAFSIMSLGIVDDATSLKGLVSIAPLICAFLAYFVSRARF